MEAEAVVELDRVTVAIGSTRILADLSLRVWPREVVGLVAPNGAGKATLLRVLSTLLAPVAGYGRVLGAELGSVARNGVRTRIALLGHDPALHPTLSLRENLRLVADLTGIPPSSAEVMLEKVGLARAADRRVERCSKGMVRRAEIARALLIRPQLLLLDEAHAGLDPAAGVLVEVLLAEVRGVGRRWRSRTSQTGLLPSSTVSSSWIMEVCGRWPGERTRGKSRSAGSAARSTRPRRELRTGEAMAVTLPFAASALLLVALAVATKSSGLLRGASVLRT